MHVCRTCTALSLFAAGLLLAASALHAQDLAADVTPGAIHTTPRADSPVEGFTRKDSNTVTLKLRTDRSLVLHDFDFDGDPVDTGKLHLRLLSPGVYELSSRAWTVGSWRFTLDDDASYYGLGEHFDTLDHAHTIVRNLAIDNAGNKGSSTSKPIPFYLSTTGYGLWLDTTGEATFDFNSTNPHQVVLDAASNQLRVVLFTGPPQRPGRFPYLLADFTELAGRSIVPPTWAFAPWQACDRPQNQAQVMEDIDKTRELGLPASVLLINGPWASAANSYEFNPKQFDDALGMVKHLHEAGFKLVLSHTPWISRKSDSKPDSKIGKPGEPGSEGKIAETSPNYAVAEERGFFLKKQDGSPYVGVWGEGQAAPGAPGLLGSLIDFTNPKARQWWQDQLRQAIKAGADGFKNDDAESSLLENEVVFFDHSDARLMRNRYGTLYNKAVEEVLQNDLKGNGVLFARSVSTGANGLGFLWAGDNDASFSPQNGLPTAVTAGLSAGLSGMPLWASDLGGYRKRDDTPNPTLLARWTEFAAFSPVMETMSEANLTPWTFDQNSNGTTALDIYRKYAVLHTSLFPYLYAAAQEAATTGQPILRALVLNYQDDARARSIKDEYLLGPDLLVAPVIDENMSRPVYLPVGDWINLFTGKQVTGPKTFVADAPLDTIPVYARRGTVLPKIPEDVMTLVSEADSGNKTVHSLDSRRIFEVLGAAADNTATFKDFEGRTVLRSGNTLRITAPEAEAKASEKTQVQVKWRFITPHSATVNGANVPVKTDRNGIAMIEYEQGASDTISWQ